MADIKTLVDSKIKGKKVMVFSKSGCPFCTKAKGVLNKLNLSTDDLEIWDMERHKNLGEIQDYLLELTGGRSVCIIMNRALITVESYL